MELDIIKSQTTWNDASQSINLNFAKIRQALASSGGGGGNIDALISTVYDISYLGSISTNDNSATFNAYAIDSLYKRIVLLENKEVDLTGYATETWVLAKNYITAAALSPYLKTADANSTFATLVALNALSGNVGSLEGDVSTLSSNLNTLKGRFDALDDALNDDVSGKINTWNEIVDFLDEYNGSKDLATILSGMNADIALRLKTADFDAWKTDVYSPLASRVSTAEGNISTNAKAISANTTAINTNAAAITNLGKRVTANEGNIAKILKWFAVDSNGNLYTTYNFYSTKEISANGLSIGSGSSGGGLISQVYGITAFGTIASESNSATFNAYAIDSLYKRIVSLEGKATAVSFVPALTSGKQIGTLSIDGVSTVLYGVDAYSKADADGRYLKLTGGEINGYLSVSHATQSIALGVNSKSTDYVAIRFTGANGNSAYLVYSGNGDEWAVTPPNWAGSRILLHSNNYSQYALPLSGGTLTKVDGNPLIIKRTGSGGPGVEFYAGDTRLGSLGIGTDFVPFFYNANKVNLYTIIHSGNIGEYKAGDSDKLGGVSEAEYARYSTNIYTTYHRYIGYGTSTGGFPQNGGAVVAGIANYSMLLHGRNGVFRFNTVENGSLTGWKTVAFTDSNVASATKLATARTIWGQSFDGSGNVTGALKTPSGYNAVTILDSYLVLGQGMAENSLPTYLDGYNVYMRYGKSSTIGFTLNSSGNTTIGSTGDLAGTTYKLYINGSANIANALTVATNVQIPINGDRITFCSATGTYTKGILAMNTSNTYLEAPLATDSASGAKPAIMIGWRGCSAATGTTKPYPITIISGEIALNGTTAINGTLKNVNNIYPNSAGERYIGTSTNPFKYMYAEWYGAGTGQTLSFGANNATHIWVDTSGRVGIGTTSPQHKLEVTGDIASSGSLRMGLNSAYGAYLQTNEEGWTGIYSANKGSWQATNMYLMPDGDVKFAHAARVIGKNTNGDTGLFVEGTQYSMWFGVGSGNVNRGIFDINNNGWWIYRGSDTLTRISGGIETSTGSFTGAVTMYSTLAVAGISTFEQEVRHKIGIRPNADNTRYVGTSSYRFNEGYINNMYTNAMYVGKGTTYGFKSDGSINATAITANSGVKVASGQALTFLDASGKEHKLTYDSTAGAFKFDGNVYATEEVSANGIGTSGTIETTANVSLSIDGLMSLAGRTDVSQSTMDIYGLTTDVVNKMLAGKYNKILGNSNTAGIWDYDCWQSNTGNATINLKQGDGIGINQAIILKQVTRGTSLVWSVIFTEI